MANDFMSSGVYADAILACVFLNCARSSEDGLYYISREILDCVVHKSVVLICAAY